MNYVAERSGKFEVCDEVYRKGMHSAGRRGTEKQEHRWMGYRGGVQRAGGSIGAQAQLQLLAYQIRGIHNFD